MNTLEDSLNQEAIKQDRSKVKERLRSRLSECISLRRFNYLINKVIDEVFSK